jgi:hypothetical protein
MNEKIIIVMLIALIILAACSKNEFDDLTFNPKPIFKECTWPGTYTKGEGADSGKFSCPNQGSCFTYKCPDSQNLTCSGSLTLFNTQEGTTLDGDYYYTDTLYTNFLFEINLNTYLNWNGIEGTVSNNMYFLIY